MTGNSQYEAPDGSFSYEQEVRGDIVIGQPRGVQEAEHSRAMLVELVAAGETIGPRFKWLVDFSGLDSVTADGRKIMTDFTMGADSPIERLAACGMNPLMRDPQPLPPGREDPRPPLL